jgi:hypothetical protein
MNPSARAARPATSNGVSAAHAAPVKVAVNALRLWGIVRALWRTSPGYRALARAGVLPIVVGLFLALVACLEHPRRGLIRLDATDQIIEKLRQSIR